MESRECDHFKAKAIEPFIAVEAKTSFYPLRLDQLLNLAVHTTTKQRFKNLVPSLQKI